MSISEEMKMGKERQGKLVRTIKEDIEEYRKIKIKLLNVKMEVNPKVMERILHLFDDVGMVFDMLGEDLYGGKETY